MFSRLSCSVDDDAQSRRDSPDYIHQHGGMEHKSTDDDDTPSSRIPPEQGFTRFFSFSADAGKRTEEMLRAGRKPTDPLLVLEDCNMTAVTREALL